MSVYTCITCRVVFVDGETQRAHYKADWHRYNLKRKVADLPPVSAENFRQRVLNAQQTQVTEEKTSLNCGLCGKHFNTQNAMQNHVQSKKHKDAEAKEAEKVRRAEDKQNEKNESKGVEVLPENAKRVQKDLTNQALKNNLRTTAEASSSKVQQGATGAAEQDEDMDDAETDSEVESVDSFDDEDGLGIEECLFCSFISQSMEASVQHMTVKHSFFLPDAEYISDLEGLITYLGQKVGEGHICLWCNNKGKGFHTAKSVQQHMVDRGHCKMLHEGNVLVEYADYYDYRSSYPDFEPGSDGDAGEEHMDTEVDPDVLAADGYELVLPSGATIGHRSLQKYYRQNINPRSSDRTKSILPKMLAQYKALGWHGATGPIAERRVKDLGAMQRMKNRHYARLGQKANKFQPHFRPQVIF